MGILKSKKRVYVCINQDRINMYSLPLTATPIRQFLYDCESISATSEVKGKKNSISILRLKVNKKEYIFQLDCEEQTNNWAEYINKVSKGKDIVEAPLQRKTWRTPHVTMKRFIKEANTFDLLQFQDHGVKTLGVILQTIDMGASKDLLYNNSPEILYYNHYLEKLSMTPIEDVLGKDDAFIIPMVNLG
mmetsp:Transcript_801/g.962  ORF Transcript_801/g.962 Transcript_801/m.962 type:complete len:189 (+) Transcript_801:340-906(+)